MRARSSATASSARSRRAASSSRLARPRRATENSVSEIVAAVTPMTTPVLQSADETDREERRHSGERDAADRQPLVAEPRGGHAGVEVQRRTLRRAEHDLGDDRERDHRDDRERPSMVRRTARERAATEHDDDDAAKIAQPGDQQHEGGRGRRGR